MSRASNSLKISDVTTTPIKLKYSASYSNTTICDSGIYAQSALNGPVTVTGSVPQRTLRYWSIRHLFYSNFLTGSYLTTTSSLDNSLQSTAASGTLEDNTTATALADIRYFPTESNAKVKIINIPRSSFGEKTSRKSFSLTANDLFSYHLVDDGNGNVYDTLDGQIHVGNIIYPEGFVIITNPNYYCVMDGGPFTFPKQYTFDITDSPKTFNPISDAQADCAPVDPTTLQLISASGFLFPSSSQDSSGNVTLSASDPLTNIIGTYRDFYTVKSTYCAGSDKQPITVNIVDCTVTNPTATALSCSINGLTITLVPNPTPTPTFAPTCTPTPSPTQSPTPSPTPTPSVTPSPTPSPSPSPSATPSPSPTPSATIPPPTPSQTPTPSATPAPVAFLLANNCADNTVRVYNMTNGSGQYEGTALYFSSGEALGGTFFPVSPIDVTSGYYTSRAAYASGVTMYVAVRDKLNTSNVTVNSIVLAACPTPTPTPTVNPGDLYTSTIILNYVPTAQALSPCDPYTNCSW